MKRRQEPEQTVLEKEANSSIRCHSVRLVVRGGDWVNINAAPNVSGASLSTVASPSCTHTSK
jgi:hypothetical protein